MGRLVSVSTNAGLHKGTLCGHSLEVLAVVIDPDQAELQSLEES